MNFSKTDKINNRICKTEFLKEQTQRWYKLRGRLQQCKILKISINLK